MKVDKFKKAIKIASKVVNDDSLSNLNKSIEISRLAVRAFSEYGNVEIMVEDTSLERPCLVNGRVMLAVLDSLASAADIQLVQKENTLAWSSGVAKGHWNLVQSDDTIPAIGGQANLWEPPVDLIKALTISASTCNKATMSVGLFGLVIIPNGDGTTTFASSNSISLINVKLQGGNFRVPVTIRPPVPLILVDILENDNNVTMDVTENGIFVLGETVVATLPLSVPLEQDLIAIANNFTTQERVVKVNTLAVDKFLNRVRSLAESKHKLTVRLSVKEGSLILDYEGMAASSEEYFLAEGLDPNISYSSITLPVEEIRILLEHVDYAVLDYLPQNYLVFRGSNPAFQYVIGGYA